MRSDAASFISRCAVVTSETFYQMMNRRACRLWIVGGDALSPRVAAFMQRPRVLSARQLAYVTKLALQRWRHVQVTEQKQNPRRASRTGEEITRAICGVLRVQSVMTPEIVRTVCDLWRPHAAVTRAISIAAANGVAMTPECVDALQEVFGHGACTTVRHTPAEMARRYERVTDGVDVCSIVEAWEAACTAAELLELRAFDAWMADKPRFGAVVDVANVGTAPAVAADASAATATTARSATLFVLSRAFLSRGRLVTDSSDAYVYVVRDVRVNDDIVWLYAALQYGVPDVTVHTMDRCRDHMHRLNVHAAAQDAFPASGLALRRWLQRHAMPRHSAELVAVKFARERCTQAPVIVLPCLYRGSSGYGSGSVQSTRRMWCVVNVDIGMFDDLSICDDHKKRL